MRVLADDAISMQGVQWKKEKRTQKRRMPFGECFSLTGMKPIDACGVTLFRIAQICFE